MNCFLDIKNVYYINLESRPDRKIHVEKELKNIGLQGTRFNAIKCNNGAIGCTRSHLEVLKIAVQLKLDHILIVEDDIQFLNPRLFVRQLDKFLSKNKNWDVVLIGGNNIGKYSEVDDTCIKITRCRTTTGYLVKNHYFEILIKNIEDGLQKFIKEPSNPLFYAIDQYWSLLQQKDNWYLIIPLTIKQRLDYSDIEKCMTDYNNMLEINKDTIRILQSKHNINNRLKQLNFK